MFTEMERWPLQSPTHLTRVAGGWLDMIMRCWHQKKCWRAHRTIASSKHVIYGCGNGSAKCWCYTSIHQPHQPWCPCLALASCHWLMHPPGLQSPRNRLKSTTQCDWLAAFFKSQLLQLRSMQFAFCAYCITAEGENRVCANRGQILTFIPTVIWIQAVWICKWTPTYTVCLTHTCHGLQGCKVASGFS